MSPRLLLRLEGVAVFACALFFYRFSGAGWVMFIALFLVPDLSMLGYAANAKVGSAFYNAAHTEIVPALLVACSAAVHRPYLLAVGLIWLAHIGFDRALGYGLKYPTFFKDTHMQRV